eukprot:gene3238-2220_t
MLVVISGSTYLLVYNTFEGRNVNFWYNGFIFFFAVGVLCGTHGARNVMPGWYCCFVMDKIVCCEDWIMRCGLCIVVGGFYNYVFAKIGFVGWTMYCCLQCNVLMVSFVVLVNWFTWLKIVMRADGCLLSIGFSLLKCGCLYSLCGVDLISFKPYLLILVFVHGVAVDYFVFDCNYRLWASQLTYGVPIGLSHVINFNRHLCAVFVVYYSYNCVVFDYCVIYVIVLCLHLLGSYWRYMVDGLSVLNIVRNPVAVNMVVAARRVGWVFDFVDAVCVLSMAQILTCCNYVDNAMGVILVTSTLLQCCIVLQTCLVCYVGSVFTLCLYILHGLALMVGLPVSFCIVEFIDVLWLIRCGKIGSMVFVVVMRRLDGWLLRVSVSDLCLHEFCIRVERFLFMVPCALVGLLCVETNTFGTGISLRFVFVCVLGAFGRVVYFGLCTCLRAFTSGVLITTVLVPAGFGELKAVGLIMTGVLFNAYFVVCGLRHWLNSSLCAELCLGALARLLVLLLIVVCKV